MTPGKWVATGSHIAAWILAFIAAIFHAYGIDASGIGFSAFVAVAITGIVCIESFS